MALSEFMAMEAAYRALQDLDMTARSRALLWLTDALNVPGQLPGSGATNGSASPSAPAASVVASAAQDAETAFTAPLATAVPVATAAAEAGVDAPVVPAQAGPTSVEAVPAKRSRTTKKPSARRARSTASNGDSGAERAYRKMPPVDDVLAAYRKVGTISGLADYFDVPRHTVQGWAHRLRGQGYEIGRSA